MIVEHQQIRHGCYILLKRAGKHRVRSTEKTPLLMVLRIWKPMKIWKKSVFMRGGCFVNCGIFEYRTEKKGAVMFDIERLMKVMSEILSDKYDAKITLTAVPKDQAQERAAG